MRQDPNEEENSPWPRSLLYHNSCLTTTINAPEALRSRARGPSVPSVETQRLHRPSYRPETRPLYMAWVAVPVAGRQPDSEQFPEAFGFIPVARSIGGEEWVTEQGAGPATRSRRTPPTARTSSAPTATAALQVRPPVPAHMSIRETLCYPRRFGGSLTCADTRSAARGAPFSWPIGTPAALCKRPEPAGHYRLLHR